MSKFLVLFLVLLLTSCGSLPQETTLYKRTGAVTLQTPYPIEDIRITFYGLPVTFMDPEYPINSDYRYKAWMERGELGAGQSWTIRYVCDDCKVLAVYEYRGGQYHLGPSPK
jgi:hypothetical protein